MGGNAVPHGKGQVQIVKYALVVGEELQMVGKVNAVACVGEGKIRIGGMISQVDNVNRILDRVALYLA